MDNKKPVIEKIKKQLEEGNRWVEANTDDIKQALSELGYHLLKELPTLKDVFPAGGVPKQWAKAIECYRSFLIGCGITLAKHPPDDKRDLRETLISQLKAVWLAGNCIKKFRPDEVPMDSLGDIADKFLSLSPMEVLSGELKTDLKNEFDSRLEQARSEMLKGVLDSIWPVVRGVGLMSGRLSKANAVKLFGRAWLDKCRRFSDTRAISQATINKNNLTNSYR